MIVIRKNSINRLLKKKWMNRCFTLLETMIALTLLIMAAGAIGWKMAGWVEKRRFKVDLEQFQSRLRTIHRMAINMQADWEGNLEKDGSEWSFRAQCLDPPGSKKFRPIKLRRTEIKLNEKEEKSFTFIFYSSGTVWPMGALQFKSLKDGAAASWELPLIFGKEEGDGVRELGPLRPNEA